MPKAAKTKKDPNAPKRPLSAYMIFATEKRPQVLKENPGIKFGKFCIEPSLSRKFFFYRSICRVY